MSKKFKPLEMKLRALDYHSSGNIDISNRLDVKALVIWLEDQKIRHYKMDDRNDLRNNTGDNWVATFQKYCKDLNCPFDPEVEHVEVLDWLITVALKLEYSDEADHTPSLRAGLSRPEVISHGSSTMQTPKSSLDIDPSNEIFQKGIKAIARVLQIGNHPDLTVLLAACRMVIHDKLTESALKDCKDKPKGYFSPTPQECGFDFNDPVLAEAAKVLRLLHIEELRKLQTSINELIVEVQRLTADPKTDQSLGKVGR